MHEMALSLLNWMQKRRFKEKKVEVSGLHFKTAGYDGNAVLTPMYDCIEYRAHGGRLF